MSWVFDASSLAAVSVIAHDEVEVFDKLTELVERRRVATFCDEVVTELARIARDEMAYTWANAIKGARFDLGATWERKKMVVALVPQMVDPSAQWESSAAAALAQAVELDDTGVEVTVVTEDTRTKPTRLPLAAGCEQFDIKCIRLAEFLSTQKLRLG